MCIFSYSTAINDKIHSAPEKIITMNDIYYNCKLFQANKFCGFVNWSATAKALQWNNQYGHTRLPCSHETVNTFKENTVEFTLFYLKLFAI